MMNLCVGALMVLIAKPSAPAQREGSPLRAFLSLVLCKEQLQKLRRVHSATMKKTVRMKRSVPGSPLQPPLQGKDKDDHRNRADRRQAGDRSGIRERGEAS